MIVPRYVLGGPGHIPPSDRLNIAGIGAGGKGYSDIRDAAGFNENTGEMRENVVALCDVDDERAARSVKNYPKAKYFRDFRKMLDSLGSDIDAVTISTPDHTHAVMAMAAMQMGKHVYVQKPLTHNVYEARMLTEAAKKYGVVSQMGNQGSSSDDIRRICEWVDAGVIGDITEVHCWTNRPVWAQGMVRPEDTPAVPSTLDWDLWLGPAPKRPFHPTYVPFGWRGWWDFGTGALGDMACHIMDPAVKALKLGYPSSVEAYASTFTENWQPRLYQESPPNSTKIKFEFPARGEMPPVTLTWQDGGLRPWRPDELEDDEMIGDDGGGVLFIGSKGKMMCGVYAANPTLLPTKMMAYFKEPEPTLPRVPGSTGGHQADWVRACKGEAGPKPSSDFDYAGKLTEIVLMGNLAVRSYFIQESYKDAGGNTRTRFSGRKKLLWDGENMKITNYDDANQFVKRDYRDGWSLGV